MRRNSVTLIKYLIIAALFLIFGPVALKFMLGSSENSSDFPAGVFPHGDRPHHESHDLKFQPADFAPGANQKIDWHDYKQILAEQQRTGPGEQGAAVILSASEEKKKDALYKVNGFNAYVSDKISLDRALKDIRHPETAGWILISLGGKVLHNVVYINVKLTSKFGGTRTTFNSKWNLSLETCKSKKYLAKLPNASVIVPFHNEHWSSLLRTVHSVLNRSPKHLIHEIILVDDYSSKDHCKKQLDDHVRSHYNGKVKVVRAKKREGLIRTRLLGAKAAKGDVLIFLDSHVEAGINWLPPLLEPIAKDHKTVVCPFIDVLDYETFAYRAQDEGARGAFDWEFFYKRLPLLPEDLQHPAEPFKSPVMAGGLFAIHRDWFWTLGGYDPGLDIWGGEQYELSFKIWQCDGQMVDAPCSRVGHVYRKFAPFPNPGVGDFVGRNYKRVAEVWMDEYKEYLYKRRPHYRHIDAGDLTAQLAIRKKLHCKPFKWFMAEVAFDLPKHYPPVEPPSFAEGEIRSVGTDLCVDTRFRGQNERFALEQCIKDSGAGGEQQMELTWHKDIRPRKRNVCFDVSTAIPKAPVILYNCHGMKGNQHWKYNLDTKQLFHPISGQCLDCDRGRREIFMNPCNPQSVTQKWQFEKLNEKEIRKEWNS